MDWFIGLHENPCEICLSHDHIAKISLSPSPFLLVGKHWYLLSPAPASRPPCASCILLNSLSITSDASIKILATQGLVLASLLMVPQARKFFDSLWPPSPILEPGQSIPFNVEGSYSLFCLQAVPYSNLCNHSRISRWRSSCLVPCLWRFHGSLQWQLQGLCLLIFREGLGGWWKFPIWPMIRKRRDVKVLQVKR